MCPSIFLVIFSLLTASASSKKYDVNAECIKLYGEDLRTVVKRFRRTPAYLTILTSRVEKMQSHLTDVMLQEFTWYSSHKLGDKIAEKFPKDVTTEAPSTTKKGDDRRLYDVKREQGELEAMASTPSGSQSPNDSSVKRRWDDNDEDAIEWFPRRRRVLNRRKEEGSSSCESSGQANVTVSPVLILDAFRESDSNMTVDDINEARNIGFEAFGDIIHNIIRDMGGTIQDEVQSTQMPGGGGPTNSTSTTHAQKHTVGDSNEETTPATTKEAKGVTDNTL